MRRIPRTHDRQDPTKGRWRFIGPHVSISCPDCGQMAILDHDIEADGRVKPSVVCPFEGCGFHEFVTLLDWEPHPGRENRPGRSNPVHRVLPVCAQNVAPPE